MKKLLKRRLAGRKARLDGALLLAAGAFSVCPLSAQSRPQQVPLSGRTGESGAVSVSQQPAGGAGSVDTVSTTVQVGGDFAGSVTGAAPARRLSVADAIQRGLQYNLGTRAAARSEQQTVASQANTRSSLLPSISGQLSETVAKTNLTATGFDPTSFPSIGQYFPSTIGPYHYYSALVNVSDNVLDVVALRNLATLKKQVEVAKLGSADAREQVVLAVAGSYLRVLSSVALIASEEAQVRYSQSVYDSSVAQEAAGTKSLLDVNRNQVQLQTEQQRLAVDRGNLLKNKMILAREIGMSIDDDFELTDKLMPDTETAIALQAAYGRALGSRTDLRAAEVQVRVAESASKAAGAQRLPSLRVQGYYGLQGRNFNGGASVYNGTLQLNIPIYNGGQIRSDERLADAAVEQRQSELADTREQVRFDVRSAWIDRDVAAKQVPVAESNRRLAADTLRQSNDRFLAGAATSVDVVQAEEAVASAERDYINSLFSLNLAKINLARAMGEAEKDIPVVLKGAQ